MVTLLTDVPADAHGIHESLKNNIILWEPVYRFRNVLSPFLATYNSNALAISLYIHSAPALDLLDPTEAQAIFVSLGALGLDLSEINSGLCDLLGWRMLALTCNGNDTTYRDEGGKPRLH